MDSIVILDDDDEEASTSASTSYSHATNCQSKTPVKNQLPPPTHISQSPFASAKKDVHVLQAENQKLFAEVCFLTIFLLQNILTTHYKYC